MSRDGEEEERDLEGLEQKDRGSMYVHLFDFKKQETLSSTEDLGELRLRMGSHHRQIQAGGELWRCGWVGVRAQGSGLRAQDSGRAQEGDMMQLGILEQASFRGCSTQYGWGRWRG